MANSFGTLVPEILVRDTIESLKVLFPPIFDFAHDFRSESALFGQSVKARFPVNPTASDYHVTNGYVAADASVTEQSISINKHKHVTMQFGEQEISGTNRNLVQEQINGAAYALGKAAVDDLFALVTVANFPSDPHESVEQVANTDRETATALRKKLVGRGVPTTGLVGVVNSDVFENMSNQTNIQSRDINGPGVDYVAGQINGVSGFRSVYEWPNMPTAETLIGYFGSNRSLGIAARVPDDAAKFVPGLGVPGIIKVETDPATGLSIMYRFWYDMGLGKLFMTLTFMYGVALLDVNAGQRLSSASN